MRNPNAKWVNIHDHKLYVKGFHIEKIMCICGQLLNVSSYGRHLHSQKHLRFQSGLKKDESVAKKSEYKYNKQVFTFEENHLVGIECVCGSKLRPSSYNNHILSAKHIAG